MEAAWRSDLADRKVPDSVVAFFDREGIHNSSRLANYIDSREEIMPLLIRS